MRYLVTTGFVVLSLFVQTGLRAEEQEADGAGAAEQNTTVPAEAASLTAQHAVDNVVPQKAAQADNIKAGSGQVAAQADKKPLQARLRLFVSDYEISEGAPIDAKTANSILAARMSRLGSVFDFVTTDEVRKVLDLSALQQMLGSDVGPDALVNLGEQISADRLVHGHMGRVGKTFVSTLTLYNLSTGKVEKRIAGTFQGAQDLAITRLNEQADQLLAHLLKNYAPDQLNKKRRVAVHLGGKRKAHKKLAHKDTATGMQVVGYSAMAMGLGLGVGAGLVQSASGDQLDTAVPISIYVGAGALVIGGAALTLWNPE